MNVVWLFEATIILLGVGFFVSQVAIPIFRGTQLFPILRRERRLEAELLEEQQEAHESELKKELEELRAQRLRREGRRQRNRTSNSAS